MKSKRYWVLNVIVWFCMTFGLFVISEKFRDVNWVLYPSVFLLIMSLLLGPGTLALLTPHSENPKTEQLRTLMWPAMYIGSYALMRMLSLFCFRMHWL